MSQSSESGQSALWYAILGAASSSAKTTWPRRSLIKMTIYPSRICFLATGNWIFDSKFLICKLMLIPFNLYYLFVVHADFKIVVDRVMKPISTNRNSLAAVHWTAICSRSTCFWINLRLAIIVITMEACYLYPIYQ